MCLREKSETVRNRVFLFFPEFIGGVGMYGNVRRKSGMIAVRRRRLNPLPALRAFWNVFPVLAGICLIGCVSDTADLCQGAQVEKFLKYSFSYELLSRQDLPQAEFSGFRKISESGSFVTCEARLRLLGNASGLHNALLARFGGKRLHKYEGLLSGRLSPAAFPDADRRTLKEIRYLRGIAALTAEENYGDRIFEVEFPVIFMVHRATGKPENADFGAGVYGRVYQLLESEKGN